MCYKIIFVSASQDSYKLYFMVPYNPDILPIIY